MAHARAGASKLGAWAYGCYAWGVFALILPVFGGMVMLLRKPPLGRRIIRVGARLLCWLVRLPIPAKGLEKLPAGPHVLLANHASFLDEVVLTALLPSRPGYVFVVRQQFPAQRLLCPLLRGLGTLVLMQSDPLHGTRNVELMAAALRRGKRLIVFPEGGFVPEPGLRAFHSGAFVAAANAGVPVAVAGLRGTRAALRSRTWLPRRVAITLEIGPVLMIAGNDPAALAQASATARKAMLSLSDEADSLSSMPPGMH